MATEARIAHAVAGSELAGSGRKSRGRTSTLVDRRKSPMVWTAYRSYDLNKELQKTKN